MSELLEILKHDSWAGSSSENGSNPFILRWRTPVVEASDVGEYIHLLNIVWPYAEENNHEMPDESISEAMEIFENRLIDAWEHDGNAILTAVLTYDGARQWVFYTKNVNECGERLVNMPQETEPYPIELTTEEDPEASYLRRRILGNINWQDYQSEWEEGLKSGT